MSAMFADFSPPPLPRLMIVGDVALFRDGIRAAVAATGRFDIVGSLPVGDAVAVIADTRTDVVIFDASRRRALNQARELIAAAPGIGIVAFGVGGVEDALVCAQAGVRAFVGEQGTIEAICDAAEQAAQGLSVCSPELTARLLDRFARISNDTEARAHGRLTSRENEIARMVAEGLSNKQIARALAISPATVKNHVHAILAKFDLPRRSGIGRQLRGELVATA